MYADEGICKSRVIGARVLKLAQGAALLVSEVLDCSLNVFMCRTLRNAVERLFDEDQVSSFEWAQGKGTKVTSFGCRDLEARLRRVHCSEDNIGLCNGDLRDLFYHDLQVSTVAREGIHVYMAVRPELNQK